MPRSIRYKALEAASWEYWRSVNRMVLAIGGTCITNILTDGSTQQYYLINNQTFDATPPAWKAQETTHAPV